MSCHQLEDGIASPTSCFKPSTDQIRVMSNPNSVAIDTSEQDLIDFKIQHWQPNRQIWLLTAGQICYVFVVAHWTPPS